MGDISVLTSPTKVKLSPVDKKKSGGESVLTKQGDEKSVASAATSSVVTKTGKAKQLRPINGTPHMTTLEDVTRIDTTRYVLS